MTIKKFWEIRFLCVIIGILTVYLAVFKLLLFYSLNKNIKKE